MRSIHSVYLQCVCAVSTVCMRSATHWSRLTLELPYRLCSCNDSMCSLSQSHGCSNLQLHIGVWMGISPLPFQSCLHWDICSAWFAWKPCAGASHRLRFCEVTRHLHGNNVQVQAIVCAFVRSRVEQVANRLTELFGPTAWQNNLASAPDRSIWPHRLTDLFGTTTWQNCLARPPDRYVWPDRLTDLFGPTAWQIYLAPPPDRTVWPNRMTDLFGPTEWQIFLAWSPDNAGRA